MKRSIAKRFTLFVFSLLPSLDAGAKQTEAMTLIVIENVNVVLPEKETVLRNRYVAIENGIISAIQKKPIRRRPGVHYLDGSHRYLIPGLIDAHVHLAYLQAKEYAPVELKLHLANGVTTVRNMIGSPLHLKLRSEIENGNRLGPRIYTASPSFVGAGVNNTPAEGRDYVCYPASGCIVFTSLGAEQLVTQFKIEGYDYIKVWEYLPALIYEATLQAAKLQNLQVVGHIPNEYKSTSPSVLASKILSENLQFSLEHLSGFEYEIEQDSSPIKDNLDIGLAYLSARLAYLDHTKLKALVRAAKKSSVFQVPTLSVYWNFNLEVEGEDLSKKPDVRYLGSCWIQRQKDNAKSLVETLGKWNSFESKNLVRESRLARIEVVKAMNKAGIPMVAGSDYGEFLVPGFSLHDELDLFVRAGLTPGQALKTATTNAARLLNNPRIGKVKVGSAADLVLLDANPLINIGATRKIHTVIRNGKVLIRDTLNQLLSEALAEASQIPCGDPQ